MSGKAFEPANAPTHRTVGRRKHRWKARIRRSPGGLRPTALLALLTAAGALAAAELAGAGAPDRGPSGGTCEPGEVVRPNPPQVEGAARVEVRADDAGTAISPYVYGLNGDGWQKHFRQAGLVRIGGNRWSAYNWETNASNAGSDWHHQNDGYLGGGDTPGEAVRRRVAQAHAMGAAALVTIPMLDRVAADKAKGGDVAKTPNYLDARFVENRPSKRGPPAYPPDRTDGRVHQDEFVHWLERREGRGGPPLFYSLDNEPSLWPETHARVHPDPTRYDELLERSIAFARMVKEEAGDALVFGPASFGWMGMDNLRRAPDRKGESFLAFYLDGLRRAEARAGRRLLDVLDVHWYPEVRVDGVRVTRPDHAEKVVRARLESTRSLWDPSFDEGSWITRHGTRGPIRLLARLKALVDRHYPGTRIAITEYYFGGGGDVSGALAQADVLGIFGREGVFAAALWPMGDDHRFVLGAFRMYRDYDGEGGAFGDTAIPAKVTDPDVSVYASTHEDRPGRVTLVAVNRAREARKTVVSVAGAPCLERARTFRLTAASPHPRADEAPAPKAPNVFEDVLPPRSVTTWIFEPKAEETRS